MENFMRVFKITIQVRVKFYAQGKCYWEASEKLCVPELSLPWIFQNSHDNEMYTPLVSLELIEHHAGIDLTSTF